MSTDLASVSIRCADDLGVIALHGEMHSSEMENTLSTPVGRNDKPHGKCGATNGKLIWLELFYTSDVHAMECFSYVKWLQLSSAMTLPITARDIRWRDSHRSSSLHGKQGKY